MEMGPYRTALGIFSVFALVSALYAILPAVRPGWRCIFPGAATTILLWGSAIGVFSFYLRNFGAYDVTYGSLGGVVIAMIFFYSLGAIFLFGAEVNAAIAKPVEEP
jgi:membrane protein